MRAASPAALTAAVLALAAAPLLAQERDFSKVEVKAEKVAGNVHMLTGAGGNIGVSIGPDGVLIVDDQFAPLVPKIQAAIKGLTDQPVRFVLNTHWHGDHTGGNAELGKAATVIAHDNVRKRLAEGHPSLLGNKVEPAPPAALPVITFGQSLTVHVNGEAIQALHYAKGHTDGDSVVYFTKSNVVHMGDNFVTYGLPFVDVSSGGSVVGLATNVEKAMASLPDDVKVIPGHGPVSTKAEVKKFTELLRDCIALVKAARDQGQTLEQMKSENVLKKYDHLGQGFVKTPGFIEVIFNELAGDPSRTAQKSRAHH
jgi:glyoxylase-like metal-dependent hydrolase (beta-lactamase superfamily II)